MFRLLDVVKKLTKLGNSLGLVIDKPILELLKIDAETPIELSTDGTRIILTPVSTRPNRRALEAARKVMREQADTLKKLAK